MDDDEIHSCLPLISCNNVILFPGKSFVGNPGIKIENILAIIAYHKTHHVYNKVIGYPLDPENLEKPGIQTFGPEKPGKKVQKSLEQNSYFWKTAIFNLENPGTGPLVGSGNPESFIYL